MAPRTRVLFLIPSLVAHGAERQLCELVRAMDGDRFEIHVAVFYDPAACEGGDLAPRISGLPHVSLHSLHKRRGLLGNLAALPRLARLARRLDPDVVHGYMDGNLPALLAAKRTGARAVWGIRRTNSDLDAISGFSRWLLRLSIRLSRFADLIIFNSDAGQRRHEALGMRGKRMLSVPNGFDTEAFRPDAPLGRAQRAAWGVPEDAPLIGIVGRFAPVKDHPTFLRAAARVKEAFPHARFVCVGGGPEGYLASLKAQAGSLGLGDRILWPGPQTDMPPVYNALSVLALSSSEEGFPNVLGEAMACGVPCATTRAGDAERLAGGTGLAVAPGDDQALAEAVIALLGEPAEARVRRAAACRERIVSLFSAAALARRTESALLSLLPGA